MKAETARAPERRKQNLGAPGSAERRAIADRRGENNALYIHFRIGEFAFLVPILEVQEVLRSQHMTPVPRAARLIKGLINLRGEIVPAVDLRAVLDLPETARALEMNVVVRQDEGAFSLVVDEVFDVLPASPTMLAPPPPNLPPRLRELVAGVYKAPQALLLILDAARVSQFVDPRHRS